jgi:hypothetical protein
MKKSYLWCGLSFIGIGCVLIGATIIFDTRLQSLLYGFAGALIGPGAVMAGKYFYWIMPENAERYKEKLDHESIEIHDERNEGLRNKAGRYAFLLSLFVISTSIVVFSILGELEVIENTRIIIMYLGALFLFQIVSLSVFHRHLQKKC